jgi:hypothetical protein
MKVMNGIDAENEIELNTGEVCVFGGRANPQ